MRELYLYSDGCWEYQNIKETMTAVKIGDVLFEGIRESSTVFWPLFRKSNIFCHLS